VKKTPLTGIFLVLRGERKVDARSDNGSFCSANMWRRSRAAPQGSRQGAGVCGAREDRESHIVSLPGMVQFTSLTLLLGDP
jgi:hypothetical protein